MGVAFRQTQSLGPRTWRGALPQPGRVTINQIYRGGFAGGGAGAGLQLLTREVPGFHDRLVGRSGK